MKRGQRTFDYDTRKYLLEEEEDVFEMDGTPHLDEQLVKDKNKKEIGNNNVYAAIPYIRPADIHKMVDKRAMPGQTIQIPEGAKTEYSPNGNYLKKFSYSYANIRDYVIDHESFDPPPAQALIVREYVGKYDERTKKMMYSSYDSNGEKETDYYSSWFFTNETDAYKFMWETTQDDKTGWINTERIAYITEDGVYVSSNAFSNFDYSVNVYETETKEEQLYIKGKKILAQLHTHPSLPNVGQAGFSGGDRRSSKSLLGAFQIVMEFNNNVSIMTYRDNTEMYVTEPLKPKILNKDNLLNGNFKLIPFLKSLK